MSIDLAVPDELLNPLTGELVRTADLPAVAVALEQLREHRQQVADAIGAFSEAVVAESRRLGTRTLTAGAVRLEVSADSEIEWDVSHLFKLRGAGLPDERLDALVRPQVTYKIDGTVARQLAGSNPVYARIIDEAKVRVPKKPYVRVKPGG